MKCPNCNEHMKHKKVMREVREPFHTGPSDYYDLNLYHKVDVYKCSDCHIKNDDGDWKIPHRYAPTEKQINTIQFINDRLGTDEVPLTKHQCWEFINKNFDKAKKVKPHHWWEDITDEDCEEMGLDASMFY